MNHLLTFKKSILFTAILVLASSMGFVSCTKKNPEPNTSATHMPDAKLNVVDLFYKSGKFTKGTDNKPSTITMVDFSKKITSTTANVTGGGSHIEYPVNEGILVMNDATNTTSATKDDVVLFIALDVDNGATLEVTKDEKESSMAKTNLGFGIGKVTDGFSGMNKTVTDLPTTELSTANGMAQSLVGGNVIVVQFKGMNTELKTLFSKPENHVTFTVKASKVGSKPTTKTIKLKGQAAAAMSGGGASAGSM